MSSTCVCAWEGVPTRWKTSCQIPVPRGACSVADRRSFVPEAIQLFQHLTKGERCNGLSNSQWTLNKLLTYYPLHTYTSHKHTDTHKHHLIIPPLHNLLCNPLPSLFLLHLFVLFLLHWQILLFHAYFVVIALFHMFVAYFLSSPLLTHLF